MIPVIPRRSSSPPSSSPSRKKDVPDHEKDTHIHTPSHAQDTAINDKPKKYSDSDPHKFAERHRHYHDNPTSDKDKPKYSNTISDPHNVRGTAPKPNKKDLSNTTLTGSQIRKQLKKEKRQEFIRKHGKKIAIGAAGVAAAAGAGYYIYKKLKARREAKKAEQNKEK